MDVMEVFLIVSNVIQIITDYVFSAHLNSTQILIHQNVLNVEEIREKLNVKEVINLIYKTIVKIVIIIMNNYIIV